MHLEELVGFYATRPGTIHDRCGSGGPTKNPNLFQYI